MPDRSQRTACRAWQACAQLREARCVRAGRALSLVLLLAGLVCLIAALALLPGSLTALQIFLALGVASQSRRHLPRTHRARRPGAEHLERIGARIERGLERLQDVQWELSENEARYRALARHAGERHRAP